MNINKLNYRKLIKINGADSAKFLQNILSNDIYKIHEKSLQYSLLLTPQGKILYDFFIFKLSQDFYLDCSATFLEDIKNKFQMYKLHSDVQIENSDIKVFISNEDLNSHCYLDPRNSALGYRLYDFGQSKECVTTTETNIFQIYVDDRLRCLVPEFGEDFMPSEFFPLDLGMDKLNSISFNKGCYVGQEVTARMNYRGLRRKYLECISINDYEIKEKDIIQNDKKVGTLLKIYGNNALALLRVAD